MTKTIQVRNVPDDVHRRLAERAAQQHRSLSDLVLEEIERMVARPTMEEFIARLATREPFNPGESAADAIRAERPDGDIDR